MVETDIDFVVHANKEVHEASSQTNEILEFRERLKKDVLSNNPKAYVIIAEYNNQPIGMALYSTVYFADEGEIIWESNIFIEKEYRNKGVAKLITKHLKQICKEKDYYAIVGAVADSNKDSINFVNSVDGKKWLDNFKLVVFKQN